MRGSGSKTLLRNFGTLYGDAIDSSDPNTIPAAIRFHPTPCARGAHNQLFLGRCSVIQLTEHCYVTPPNWSHFR